MKLSKYYQVSGVAVCHPARRSCERVLPPCRLHARWLRLAFDRVARFAGRARRAICQHVPHVRGSPLPRCRQLHPLERLGAPWWFAVRESPALRALHED